MSRKDMLVNITERFPELSDEEQFYVGILVNGLLGIDFLTNGG